MKRTSNAAEKRHLAKVAELGCALCAHLGYGRTPAEVHHVRVEHGWGRSSHFDTIGLCWTHHQAPKISVHGLGRAEFAAMYGISELELLEAVKKRLQLREQPEPNINALESEREVL
jgi:hypothetical protein